MKIRDEHRERRPGDAQAPPRSPRAGFTLVELIVVIVILAVFAGAIAPSLLRSEDRLAEQESQSVQRLVTIAAERDSLAIEPVALDYDEAAAELRLMVRRSPGTLQGEVGERAQAPWQPDPLALPVVFSRSKLVQATADGRALARGHWRLVFSQSTARPSLSLRIEAGGARDTAKPTNGSARPSWQVTLSPDDSAAARTGSQPGRTLAAAADRSIDLDAAGRGEKTW